MSVNPRTALTGDPSGAVIDSGTPKKARKYRLAESNSISDGAGGVTVRQLAGIPCWA
jgi:hypothetical protein